MSSSITYSNQAFRWYPGNDNPENKQKLEDITNWWRELNGKTINEIHITGIEQYKDGNWIPIPQNTRQDRYTIQNPQLDNTSQTIVSFTGENDLKQIETICIDFDSHKQFIIIYSSTGIERYIFWL